MLFPYAEMVLYNAFLKTSLNKKESIFFLLLLYGYEITKIVLDLS